MRRPITVIAMVLLSGTVFAWQLASKTLAERVHDADVIIVGRLDVIQSRAPSPIAGIGDVWLVTLRVSRTLKGSLPANARVSFTDVAVDARDTFGPSQERVWLLKASSDPTLFSAPASSLSVLPASEEGPIRTALQSPARHPPTTPR
jgi:hypothetical protein